MLKTPFAALLAAIVAVATPSASRAAILETIIDTDTSTIVGSISFPDFTGNSATGVLFSYNGFSHFMQSDTTSISWSVDTSTDSVIALDLSALQGTPGCGFGQNCSESTLHLSEAVAQENFKSCSFDGTLGFCGIAFIPNANIAFAPGTPAPEPSTWAMMLLGFAGLGWVGYRRTRIPVSIA